MPPIKTVCISVQNNKVYEEVLETNASDQLPVGVDFSIKEFSARFSQFIALSKTLKFIMYPDVTSFDKLNLYQFDCLEFEVGKSPVTKFWKHRIRFQIHLSIWRRSYFQLPMLANPYFQR
ncbi:hypothetical protein TNCV_3659481 [Trichonephila clavipes]|nr:hypothetical protein TNCV_3659481 [Trichonephila clavipes]